MASRLAEFWKRPGGYGDVLKIAFPLILSTSAFTIQMFIDRVFLMWYGSDTMSAAMFGGILNFTFFSLFLGTTTYVNTFVAQYDGAGRQKRVGALVWQGVYFSIGAGLLMAAIAPFSTAIINLAGHEQAVRVHEVVYFRILCIGAMFGLVAATLSCFFTGRGKTWTVMIVNTIAIIINVALDYGLIFGNWGLPRLGIAGAALATIFSSVFSCIVYFHLFLREKNRVTFASLLNWRFDKELFLRLMRYGLPSGIQFMLDILGFTFFIALIGRINSVCLAATSMTFQINTLAFMPMIGFSTAVSTLVGQSLGKNKPELAQRSTWSASSMTLLYMATIASGYVLFPQVFMRPFALHADPGQFLAIKPMVEKLLCFVAIYSVIAHASERPS